MMINILKKYQNYFLIFIFFIICIYDIGNIDALRQGTEGFYLLISNEMYTDGYFLTPRLVGDNHWSKPPLHFWLPMPIQALLNINYLTSARISILLFSFCSILLLASWYKKHFKADLCSLFFFFTSSLCVLKYSRIYMMEIPFSLLIFLSTFGFYHYAQIKKKSILIIAILFAALAVLVKGPISLAIGTATLGCYFLLSPHILKPKDKVSNFTLKDIFIWFSGATLIASTWFIYCYLTYGNEFYEYFFIRENLGKFSSKNYPISSLINGLLIYSFPLIIFLPRSIKEFCKNRDPLGAFLIINFCVSFFIWFVPNQKSHHYAVPSIFPLLMFIFHYFDFEKVVKKERRIINLLSIFLTGILILAGFLSTTIEISYFEKTSLAKILLIISLITFLLFIKLIFKKPKIYFFSLSTFYASIIILFVPLFFLPTIPAKVVNLTQDHDVSVVFRKPYFMQEGLNKKVNIYAHNKIYDHIGQTNHRYIVPLDIYKSQSLSKVAEIIHQWPLWRRGLKPQEIFFSLKNEKSENLVEYLVLLKKRQ